MIKIAIINGPNLNLLGNREPQHYGSLSLESINQQLTTMFAHRAELSFFQSNHEGVLIDHLQGLKQVAGIVINPGAFTHTSVAIRDTLIALKLPIIEVHLSNIYARENFRKHSYMSDISRGVISGLGAQGYQFAIEALLEASL